MVQGQGVVNPQIVDCRWGFSLASPRWTGCEMKKALCWSA